MSVLLMLCFFLRASPCASSVQSPCVSHGSFYITATVLHHIWGTHTCVYISVSTIFYTLYFVFCLASISVLSLLPMSCSGNGVLLGCTSEEGWGSWGPRPGHWCSRPVLRESHCSVSVRLTITGTSSSSPPSSHTHSLTNMYTHTCCSPFRQEFVPYLTW